MGSDATVRPAADEGPSVDRRANYGRLIAFALAVLGLLLLLFALFSFKPSPGWGFDLEAYLDAARRLARGESIYTADTLREQFSPGPYKLYLYSPPFAVVMMPFTMLSIDGAAVLWYVGRVVMLAIACGVMPVRPTVRCVIFAVGAVTSPVLVDMNLGNVSVVVTCLLAFMWRWLDRPGGSVALALGMCIRPVLGILLIWSAVRRQWWPVTWTIAAGVGIVVLSLPFVGIGAYFDFVTVLRNVSEVTGAANNQDLGSTIARLGGGSLGASLALYGGMALGIGAIIASLRFDRETSFMVTVGASLLLAPLLWDHYLATLLLPAAFLAQRGKWWGLLLPLLAWAATGAVGFAQAVPLLAIAGTFVPFVVRRPRDIEPPPEVQGLPSGTAATAAMSPP